MSDDEVKIVVEFAVKELARYCVISDTYDPDYCVGLIMEEWQRDNAKPQ